MLTEERFAIILETVQQKRSVRVTELCALLNASVSTVRRDINTLAEMGKLVKVASGSFHTYNRNSDGRMETMAAYAAMNGASTDTVREIMCCTTTDGAAAVVHREGLDMIYQQMAERAQVRSERYIFGKARVGVIFAAMDGTVQAVSSHAKEILEEEQWSIH